MSPWSTQRMKRYGNVSNIFPDLAVFERRQKYQERERERDEEKCELKKESGQVENLRRERRKKKTT